MKKLIFVLFVFVGSLQAAKPPAPTFSATCNVNDICTIQGSNLPNNTTLMLSVMNGCGNLVLQTDVRTSGTGILSTTVIVSDYGCFIPGWSFSLSSIGRRASVIATASASDPE